MSRADAEPERIGIAVEAAQPAGAAVGIVDDATEGAAALLGRRVLVGPLDPCGQCEVCRRGGAAVCPHAVRREVAARMRVASRWVVALGDGLELPVPAAAAVAGDVTCAYTLYARTNLAPREPAIVLGTNPIARFLVEILRAKDITPTILTDDAELSAFALAKGAAALPANATAASVSAAVAAQGLGSRPSRLLVTDARELAHAATLAGPRATLTVLADPRSADSLAALLAREVTLVGVAGPHPDLVVEAAALCVRGDIDLVAGVATTPDPTRAQVLVP